MNLKARLARHVPDRLPEPPALPTAGPEAAAGRGIGRLWISPGRIGIVAMSVVVCWVVLRVLLAGDGNLAALILVGSFFASGSRLRPGIPVLSGTGYDGQFYYRLAAGPLNWAPSAYGVRLDSWERLGRVGYPMLVWLAALGHLSFVPAAMIVVNVGAFAGLVVVSCILAGDAGRTPARALLVAGYWGFLWTIGRDTTELVAISFVVAALLAFRRGHPAVAGLALGVAVLSRETSLVVVGALVVSRVAVAVSRARSKPREGKVLRPGGDTVAVPAVPAAVGTRTALPAASAFAKAAAQPAQSVPAAVGTGNALPAASAVGTRTALPKRTATGQPPARGGDNGARRRADDLAWLVPLVCFTGWQLAVDARTGHLPILSAGGSNIGAPFVGLVSGVAVDVAQLPQRHALLWAGELLVLVVVAALAGRTLRTGSALLHERIAWVGYCLVTACVGRNVWLGDIGFRSLYELFAFSALLLVLSAGSLRVPATLVSVTWLVVAAELVVVR